MKTLYPARQSPCECFRRDVGGTSASYPQLRNTANLSGISIWGSQRELNPRHLRHKQMFYH